MPTYTVTVPLGNFGICRPRHSDGLKVLTVFCFSISIDDEIVTPKVTHRIRRPVSNIWVLSAYGLYAVLIQPVCKTSCSEIGIPGGDITSSQTQCTILKFKLAMADRWPVRIYSFCVADYSAWTAITTFLDFDVPAIAGIFLPVLRQGMEISVRIIYYHTIFNLYHCCCHEYLLSRICPPAYKSNGPYVQW